jgi:methionyl-tRNA formyltransferase
MRKNIVILCSDDWHHKYLVNLLSEKFNVVLVVVEPAKYQRRNRIKQFRVKDFYYLLYHMMRRKILGLDRFRKKYFFLPGSNCIGSIPEMMTIKNINDQEVTEKIKISKPDLTVVIGTSILKIPLLDACGEMIINVHGGYLPDYRGNHCIFFALYNMDYLKTGSTLHFVNRNIDRGDIIERIIPPVYYTDNAERIYCRAERMAFNRLCFWIEQYELGNSLPKLPQLNTGRLYKMKDRKIHHDLSGFEENLIREQLFQNTTINNQRRANMKHILLSHKHFKFN